MNKSYLGDAVYAEWDQVSQMLILTTESGLAEDHQTIYLDPPTIVALEDYIRRIKEQK